MGKYTKSEIQKQLQYPVKEARGYTRWWWFGCAVEKDEIIHELDEMLEAGIGGVELQILYPIRADDEEHGMKNHFYLSPGFFECIRFACEETKKRGMVFDMTLGSSWPFGGPFIPQNLSAPNVIPYTIDVHGPCKFGYDFTTRVYGECVGCIMGRMEHARMVPDSICDITDQMVDKYLFSWEWGKELLPVQIPEGDYKIVVFISNDKRQTVLKPLPGGEGPIIDHDRRDALRFFLKHAGNPIVEHVGAGMIQSFFCDSLEVFGQNWTDIIYEEFKVRRGYSLRPFIYALWGEIEGITDQIRYDFNKTRAELTEENFYQELTAWCHESGTISRIQAHGTWGDILKCYGAADIPEGETFSEYDRYEVNTVHRRLASSAGHVYKKQIISNESFTWLRFPRFVVTLEHLKAAADSIFLDGMNHIVNHGFAYSHKDCGKLGTPFYASTQINDKNTWWSYYKVLGAYFNRVSDWLRRGSPVVKIAIYLPQADIWAENPMSDIHMCMKLEERITTKMADGIQKAGYWFDYVNDDVICRIQEYNYEALVLIACERIPLETARNMESYVKQGGKLVCSGKWPEKSCGYLSFEENTKEVCDIFQRLEKSRNCMITESTPEGVVQGLRHYTRPDVEMECHKELIGYVHRMDGEEEIYFLSNISPEWLEEVITFGGQTKNFTVFDPLTAKEKSVFHYVREDGKSIVSVGFEPFQSLLFIFSNEIDEIWMEEKSCVRRFKDLSKGWNLKVEEKQFEKDYIKLQSWEKEERLRYFSGEGIYTKKMMIRQEEWSDIGSSKQLLLELEHIGESCEVYINGICAGILFKAPHQLNVKEYLVQGDNEIIIKVRNLLINCAIDPDYPELDYLEPVIDSWPYTTGKLNQNRHEWIYNQRERKKITSPYPSGIWGEIWLSLVC